MPHRLAHVTGIHMHPDDIRFRELDFSQFHPLDHWPGSARCRSLYGGWRNHLRMAWDYKWSGDLRSHTLCRIGRHRWGRTWTRSRGEFRSCNDCWREPK